MKITTEHAIKHLPALLDDLSDEMSYAADLGYHAWNEATDDVYVSGGDDYTDPVGDVVCSQQSERVRKCRTRAEKAALRAYKIIEDAVSDLRHAMQDDNGSTDEPHTGRVLSRKAYDKVYQHAEMRHVNGFRCTRPKRGAVR